MSAGYVALVMDESKSKGTCRLILMIIADCGNEGYEDVFVVVEKYICEKANVTPSEYWACIRELVMLGELEIMGKRPKEAKFRITIRHEQ